MELVDVASFFDKVPARSPVSHSLLFRCQVMAYDESRRDAYNAHRRVMSTAPDVLMPLNHVVEIYGTTWLVGEEHLDGWDEPHRVKRVLHKASGTANIFRLSGYLSGTPIKQTWGDLQWLVDKKELEVSSNSPQKFVAILPADVELQPYDVVVVGTQAVLVNSEVSRVTGFVEGYGMKQELAEPTTVTVSSRTYSPVTGAYTAGATSTTPAMKVRWQELYAYEDQLAERYQEGDCTWVLPSTVSVNTSTSISHGSDVYSVMAVREAYGCKVIHARLK